MLETHLMRRTGGRTPGRRSQKRNGSRLAIPSLAAASRIRLPNGVLKRRIDQYQVVVGDIQFEKRRFENTEYLVTDQQWYREGIKNDEPSWFEVTAYPVGLRPSIAYAGPIDVYQKRQGVLAVIIENTRLAQFLSQLSVGTSGAAFILRRGGAIIPPPDPVADGTNIQRLHQPLLPIAQ